MELQLPERQSMELASMATRTGRSPSDLATEAVDRLLAEDRWFQEQVQIGIDQIARGEFLEEEEMDLRFARMLRS
jgi:predicted transcriptional regulator